MTPVATIRDFEELFELFERHDVKYVIVGAYAVAFFGKPRYTKDIDVFVEATPENATRLLAALEQFGFGALGMTHSDFAEPGQTIQLGMPPTRIALLTQIDGVSFEEAWESRVRAKYGTAAVNFIGRDTLLKNKRASARRQDLLDVDMLTGEGDDTS